MPEKIYHLWKGWKSSHYGHKKDKSRQAFDREKLLNGILRACEKRPVSIEQLEKLVDDIESQIHNSLQRRLLPKISEKW